MLCCFFFFVFLLKKKLKLCVFRMKQTNFKSQIFGSILVESIIFFPWRLKMMNPLRPDVPTLIKHTALCRSSSLKGVAFLGDILIFALAVPTEWASSHQTLSAGAQASSIRQLTRLINKNTKCVLRGDVYLKCAWDACRFLVFRLYG